jgi:hypothetical protein
VSDDSVSEDGGSEDSDSGVHRLERRARWLLRAYPPDYRADRGEEIVGTLLEATPAHRGWPSARDAASLVGGGIRARRDANQRPGLAASLWQAVALGLAMYLVTCLCSLLAESAMFGWFSSSFGWSQFLPVLPLAATVAAAWSGRRLLVAIPAAVAAAAIVYGNLSLAALSHLPQTGADPVVDLAVPPAVTDRLALAVPLLSLAALVLLTGHAERPPRSWLWLLSLPAGLSVLGVIAFQWRLATLNTVLNEPIGGAGLPDPYHAYLSLITVAVAICWLVTDIRPLAGLALGFALTQSADLVVNIASNPMGTDLRSIVQLNWAGLIEVAVPLAIAGALAGLFLRRSRMSPPAAR